MGLPSPTNARNQPLDSSARKLLTLKGSVDGLCGLRAFHAGRAGETNAPDRAKFVDFKPGHPIGEVRKHPREPAQPRGSAKKKLGSTESRPGTRMNAGSPTFWPAPVPPFVPPPCNRCPVAGQAGRRLCAWPWVRVPRPAPAARHAGQLNQAGVRAPASTSAPGKNRPITCARKKNGNVRFPVKPYKDLHPLPLVLCTRQQARRSIDQHDPGRQSACESVTSATSKTRSGKKATGDTGDTLISLGFFCPR